MTESWPLASELKEKLSYFNGKLKSGQEILHSPADVVSNVQRDPAMLVQVKNTSLCNFLGQQ